ncbi:30S ribosomal protein S18 [Candidatus Parcubacteria bacterium]|nr:30S ribosomal protein S18 [Candidatus Parcubacteria bacterium]
MANFYTKKVCRFCAEKTNSVDYKDVKLLQRYLSSYGKIESRKRTGSCLKHQRRLAVALKRARHLALLPFTVR